uniref:Si:dkey-85k7.12 n=1 Tax=Maylandia zebra TaxID=106582 RepID=A0A3P9DSL9_9CICH
VLQCSNLYLPWYFLKELMMVNVTARNRIKHNDQSLITDMPNPLDIITALFLCSDGFVQQEMALKMSTCQFSVPLLLPNCDTNQCTLMLWAMRDIVKKYRPQSLSESKGFIEDRIVLSELPMISFVRLGECSSSKSEILNKLLSNSQQYHDTFVHRNMECGDSPRAISNGLTEITWYLPGGNTNIDIFSQPVAVANLRGDIESFETQYSFLCQTSAAVFVFFGDLDESECSLLTNINQKTQIFLVGNGESNNEVLRTVANKLGLSNNNIITKKKQKNDADFVQTLRKKVRDVVKNSKIKMTIEQMADIAYKLGILVDEDSPECQTAKTNAEAITAEIHDIHKYKEDQLPRNIEDYRSELLLQKKELRKKQNSYDMSTAMTCFINAISSPGTERFYFLKLMQMNLDNLSHVKLSELREKYKEKCKNSENKEEIKEIDRQISNSSLGTEHFFREMGQIYEASLSLPQTDPAHQQLQHLPKLCAQLLLDGFPLELVDGDASNIPLRWVSDVLSQLSDLISPNRKILVVTVLGVQGTGKSTLLNTMFGVQFAVSSGRCTRGAFMSLIKIDEDMKKVLNCDFMLIIDTEGLKSPELAQLDNSYEHDNELATLVVGLSDVTIVNVAMENSTEMKDILQIVVHAFLRMKEVGKKPKCVFVHQNVSDVSAHEKNLRDRKLLLEQLNEMTQAAARMEKKEENKSFTDVMEYSPDTGNWSIPGLWNGNPPMAPVNAGYSEAVYELKKNIIQLLGNCQSSAKDILDFKEWMSNLWNAVKHESFIFSFRNNLVADLYMRLCTEFNKWECEFKKEMYTWVTNAETRISNFGTIVAKSQFSDIREFLKCLKIEASTVLSTWETRLLENLRQYFKKTDGHVHLVEGYKEEFSSNVKSLRREMERSVFNQLTAAAEITQEMIEIDRIKENHIKEIENAVWLLINECWKNNVPTGETELENKFLKMWCETLKKLPCSEKQAEQIFTNASSYLRENVCTQFVSEKVRRKKMYCDTYIKEILHITDENLEKNQDVKGDIMFEVFLKQHICGIAAIEFKKVYEENDPYKCLIKNKDRFCDDFKHVVNKEDQCQKKAEEFTNQCLKPAVQDFINQSLGPKIIDEMQTCEQFSTRMSFQCSILLDLLSKEDFKNYQRYIFSYQDYVKTWLLNQILEHCSTISEFEDRHLQSCIKDAINKAKTRKSDNVKTFVEDICKELGDKLVISKDALGAFMFLNNADKEQFADWLTVSVNEMEQVLRKEFQTLNFKMKLQHLHVQPHNELFNKLVGCGKQCPFCKAPCDAGGRGHTEHFAVLHRPEGLGKYTWHVTKKLVTDICSSLVISDNSFRCIDTNGRWHPYKNYKEIYPDWKIPPDSSLEASDYWKYVMAKYNTDLAKEYNANPADIPESWNDITKEQAEKSLKKSFNINESHSNSL